jgi:hypothetical protein
MNEDLIIQLVQTAIHLARTQLEHGQAKDALLDTIQTAIEDYVEHRGQPLDPALIKPEDPL